MPIARVEAPDGKILRMEVPEGATHEQIAAFAQSQYKPEPLGFFDSATLGMKKAGVGTIQLGMDAARQFGYEFPETYAASEKVARQLDEQGRGSGVAGAVGEALGNPLTLPLAAASGGTSLLGMAGIGAGQGIAAGAIDPTQEGESRLENAAVGGAIGGVAAPVMKVAGDAISDFVTPYVKPFLKDTSTGIGRGAVKLDRPVIRPYEEIQQMAIQAYDDAAKAGGVIRPDAVNRIIGKAQAIGAKSKGAQRFQGGARDAVDTVVEKMQNLQNRGMTLKDVQEIDDILQDSISKEFVAGAGLTNEGRKISKIRDMFHNAHAELQPRDFIGGSAGFKAWREGDRLFAASSNARQIEGIIENAASADHPAMALKTGFRTLLRNKKNMRGFTPDEVKFIKHAANTGEITDALRTLGSRLNPLLHGGISGMDAGATMYGVSRASRELANKAQGMRADKVLEAITSRATGSPMPNLRIGTTPLGGAAGTIATGAGVSGVTQFPQAEPQPTPQAQADQPTQQQPIPPQSNAAPDYIQQNEGFRGAAYNDTVGEPTVGYGFNLDSGIAAKVWKAAGLSPQLMREVKAGRAQIDQAQATRLYQKSLEVAQADATAYYGDGFDELTREQQLALMDMSYQMGSVRLGKFRDLKRHIKNKNKMGIVKSIQNSKYYAQTPERARRAAQLLLKFNS